MRRCLRVDILGDGVETIMLLRYERLPNICFRCDRVGHTTNECQSEDQIPIVDGVEKPLFGAWMKVLGPFRKNNFRNLGSKSGFYDRNSNSFSRGDFSGREKLPVSALVEVNEGGKNVSEIGLRTNISMIDTCKSFAALGSMEKACINVCVNAIKDINGSDLESENVESKKSACSKKGVIAINDSGFDGEVSQVVTDKGKQVVDSAGIESS